MTTVFLHPVGLDGECWSLLPASTLAGAVRYTMLWHGDRPKPAERLTLERFAQDVVEHVDGPLDVIGLSMGGAVAQYLALGWPDRVRSLVLACTTAGGAGGQTQLERAAATEQVGMAGVLESTMQRWFTPTALAEPYNPGVDYARRRLLSDSAESFAASWRALAGNNGKSRLGTVTVPTTVFHAEQDASGTVESRQEMAELLPVSRFVTARGPHMVQLERPDEFGPVIDDHFRWVSQLDGR